MIQNKKRIALLSINTTQKSIILEKNLEWKTGPINFYEIRSPVDDSSDISDNQTQLFDIFSLVTSVVVFSTTIFL